MKYSPFSFPVQSSPELASVESTSIAVGPRKDYVFDSVLNGFAIMGVVNQRIFLSLTEVVGSSLARPLDGIKVPNKIDERFEQTMRSRILEALDNLINIDRVISVDSIDLTIKGSSCLAKIFYRNLESKEDEVFEVTI